MRERDRTRLVQIELDTHSQQLKRRLVVVGFEFEKPLELHLRLVGALFGDQERDGRPDRRRIIGRRLNGLVEVGKGSVRLLNIDVMY